MTSPTFFFKKKRKSFSDGVTECLSLRREMGINTIFRRKKEMERLQLLTALKYIIDGVLLK